MRRADVGAALVIVGAIILIIFVGCSTAQRHEECDAHGGTWTYHHVFRHSYYTCENERPTLGAR